MWIERVSVAKTSGSSTVKGLAFALLVLLAASTVDATESPCARVQVQLRTISGAIEVYEAKYGVHLPRERWMATLQDVGVLQRDFPESDRWGHHYVYQRSNAEDFDVRSIGPDGTNGTSDDQVRANDWKWTGCRTRGGCWN